MKRKKGSTHLHVDPRCQEALMRIFFALATEPQVVIDYELADDLFFIGKLLRAD